MQYGIAAEIASSHLDLGPIDTMDPMALKREYGAFFGASSLNSLSQSPSSPRSTSPDAEEVRERLLDELLGTSPLSTPPQSPRSASPTLATRPQSPRSSHSASPALITPLQSPRPSRSTSPALEAAQPPSPTELLFPAQGAPINSKKRRNRKKGRKKRTLKRKAEREDQDKNATPHPRSLKRLRRAERTETSYDTRDVPSASTGFVARRDANSGRVPHIEALLQDPSFQLIKRQEGYVAFAN